MRGSNEIQLKYHFMGHIAKVIIAHPKKDKIY
jgi:hypothetical protein